MLETLCVRLIGELKALDPDRPYIRASREEDDLESGDSHTYTGSLAVGTAYTQIDGTTEKLNTEFGMDVPGGEASLFRDRRVFRALAPVRAALEKLDDYQYRLLRYYVDHYRSMKYAPCAGYIQFLFTDLCPQSFYGVLDFYGVPKKGYEALLESCRPLGLIARPTEAGFRILLVNDLLRSFSGRVEYSVLREGTALQNGSIPADVGEDSLSVVAEVPCTFDGGPVELRLRFCGGDGELLAWNTYRDAFLEYPQMLGQTIDNELGMRLYHMAPGVEKQAKA